jgi:hypothetical protein
MAESEAQMDLKVYYQKIRQVEASLPEGDAIIVSQETPDGGRAGVVSEVPKGVAAKMIVEGRARLATPEESAAFGEKTAEAKRLADQIASAGRMQITVISDSDLRALKGNGKKA